MVVLYIDVLIESPALMIDERQFAVTMLEHHKHVVLMNAEVDLIFGPHLRHLAHTHGNVCISCGSDQHGVLKRMIDATRMWGVVAYWPAISKSL